MLRSLLNPVFDSVSTEEVGTSQGTIWDRSNNDHLQIPTGMVDFQNATITSDTETLIQDAVGVFPLSQVPDGASVYGWFWVRGNVANDGETFNIRPRLQSFGGNNAGLPELEVTVDTTSANNFTAQGEITSIVDGEDYVFRNIIGEVGASGDEGTYRQGSLALSWRLD